MYFSNAQFSKHLSAKTNPKIFSNFNYMDNYEDLHTGIDEFKVSCEKHNYDFRINSIWIITAVL